METTHDSKQYLENWDLDIFVGDKMNILERELTHGHGINLSNPLQLKYIG